jgi:uncharacterized membrane protein YsdA (DUF1294 family)
MLKWIVVGFVVMNFAAFVVMGADKLKAKRGKRRIPEKWLLVFPFAGGALGFMTAMLLFKHKLSKPAFIWNAVIFAWCYFAVLIWKFLGILQ